VDNYHIEMKDPFEIFGGIFCLKRKMILLIFIVFSSFAIGQNTQVKIDDEKQNFETVNQGEVVKLVYKITNIGNVPLILNDYEVECSCTSADYPTEPVAPGKTVMVGVTFDTKSAYERQDRTVDILCNVKGGMIKLRFKGNVLKKKS